MSEPLTILVLYGSARTERKGIGLARLAVRQIEARGDSALLADSEKIGLPLLDKMYKEYEAGTAPEPMEQMAEMIRRADGICVVAGEYNHGIPPALKNLLDHYLEEWFHRPAAILCYSAGRFGGVRGAMQLRMTLPELGMPTISSLLPVPGVSQAVTTEGEDLTTWLTEELDRFLGELAWWARAARAEAGRSGSPF